MCSFLPDQLVKRHGRTGGFSSRNCHLLTSRTAAAALYSSHTCIHVNMKVPNESLCISHVSLKIHSFHRCWCFTSAHWVYVCVCAHKHMCRFLSVLMCQCHCWTETPFYLSAKQNDSPCHSCKCPYSQDSVFLFQQRALHTWVPKLLKVKLAVQ